MAMIIMALGFWCVVNGSRKPSRCAQKQVHGMSCANPAIAAGMEPVYPDRCGLPTTGSMADWRSMLAKNVAVILTGCFSSDVI